MHWSLRTPFQFERPIRFESVCCVHSYGRIELLNRVEFSRKIFESEEKQWWNWLCCDKELSHSWRSAWVTTTWQMAFDAKPSAKLRIKFSIIPPHTSTVDHTFYSFGAKNNGESTSTAIYILHTFNSIGLAVLLFIVPFERLRLASIHFTRIQLHDESPMTELWCESGDFGGFLFFLFWIFLAADKTRWLEIYKSWMCWPQKKKKRRSKQFPS